MVEGLFELGIQANEKKAWALKNLIFALLFVLYGDELKYDWEVGADTLDAANESFLCLRYTHGKHTRTLKLPAYRLSGTAAAYFVGQATRKSRAPNVARRMSILQLLRRFRPAPAEPARDADDPEIERLWRELLSVVGPKDVDRALKSLNLNRIQLEEIRRYFPKSRAA